MHHKGMINHLLPEILLLGEIRLYGNDKQIVGILYMFQWNSSVQFSPILSVETKFEFGTFMWKKFQPEQKL